MPLIEGGVAGWSGLVWGFVVSTIVLYHGTFTINSLSHLFGNRRYQTTDASRNNFFVAVITLGEGWHNNHHANPTSARHGLAWYEFDPSWLLITVLKFFGSRIQSIDHVDGVTVDLGDGSWFNLRSSNTEPLLRLNVEGRATEDVEEVVAQISSEIAAQSAGAEAPS